ncbi:MAG: hypothetical protein LBV42_02590 [Methanobrevibacter sp.]|nr:hypothetical protein [Methanobrevibacter sp.]
MANIDKFILRVFDELVSSSIETNAIKYNDIILNYKELDVLVNKIANIITLNLKK